MDLWPHRTSWNNPKELSEEERTAWKERWPNFPPEELACRDNRKERASIPDRNALKIDVEALDKLQALRSRLGKPLLLNSAYRTSSWNKYCGGEQNSYHLRAMAFDVQMGNHDPYEFEAAALAVGFRGIGHYPPRPDGSHNFMHIDTGPSRFWAHGGKKFPVLVDETVPVFSPPPPLRSAEMEKAAAVVKGAVPTGAAGLGYVFGQAEAWVQMVMIVGVVVLIIAGLFIYFKWGRE